MIRRSIGTILGLGLALAVACGNGGSANDFGAGPSDNAPRAPGAPRDRGAAPGDTTPPFGGDLPPSDGVPGTEPPAVDCFDLCEEVRASGCDDIADDCLGSCDRLPAACLAATLDWVRCVIDVGCTNEDLIDSCQEKLRLAVDCVSGPNRPDDPGQGGQGPQ